MHSASCKVGMNNYYYYYYYYFMMMMMITALLLVTGPTAPPQPHSHRSWSAGC